jgi:hypothetical protein
LFAVPPLGVKIISDDQPLVAGKEYLLGKLKGQTLVAGKEYLLGRLKGQPIEK